MGKGRGTQKEKTSLSSKTAIAISEWLIARGTVDELDPLRATQAPETVVSSVGCKIQRRDLLNSGTDRDKALIEKELVHKEFYNDKIKETELESLNNLFGIVRKKSNSRQARKKLFKDLYL